MFRKMMVICCTLIVALALFTSPVTAKRPIDDFGSNPSQSRGWDMDVTIIEPYVYDPEDPEIYFWSFHGHITMPPVPWPVTVVLAREGVPMLPWYEFTRYYGDDNSGNFTAPVWEVNPPDSITYTFIMTAKGKTITEDVTLYFD